MSYEKWYSYEKIENYQKKRYSSLDQKIIDKLEKSIVNKIFLNYNIAGRILDIPCGYGRFHRLLHKYGDIHAADQDELIAKYQDERVGLAKSTRVCEASNMPYAENSFDVIFSFRLLQHVRTSKHRIGIFTEFYRVSKKWIVLSIYVDTLIHRISKRLSSKTSKISFLNEDILRSEFKTAKLLPIYSRSILPGVHGHKIYLLKKLDNSL
jgi:ubiquinone/menaquinone biosynthesis C-methylase UbiE